MSAQRLSTVVLRVCLVITLLKKSETAFSFQCPVQSHWKQRADKYCDSLVNYFCLYDRDEKKFTEFCRDNPDIETPGYKLIVDGSLRGDPCDHDFYQPFKFSSIGNNRCVYKQPYCSEEGQIVYRNGTEENASSCRCDYTKGFNFITSPKHKCYCKPSEEDCSCFHNTCSSDYILSPDYKCIHILYENEGETRFSCESISTVILPKDPGIASSTDNPLFEYDVLAYRKVVRVTFIVTLMIMLSVSTILLALPVLLDCFYRRKRKGAKSRQTQQNSQYDVWWGV